MQKTEGFTLIELMLVVAIIGLLAAIALPKFSNLIDKSKEAANRGALSALRGAATIYYADNDGFYPMQARNLIPRYVNESPRMYRTSRMTNAALHPMDWTAGIGAFNPIHDIPTFLATGGVALFLDCTLLTHQAYSLSNRTSYFKVAMACSHLDSRGLAYSTH